MLGVDPQMTQMDADVKLAVIRVFVRDMFLMVLFNDSLKCRSRVSRMAVWEGYAPS